MKNLILVLLLFTSLITKAQTAIDDANFQQAINTCLATNPADGMCSDSEYGAMPDWNVSTVTSMSEAFKDKSDFNGDISSWNVGSVTDMSAVFYDALAFNQDISDWDVSSVTNMDSMFSVAILFNQNLNSWDVSQVTNMSYMFESAISFNGNIIDWDINTTSATMTGMFENATAFNQPIGQWDVTAVTNMYKMFSEALLFNQNLENWNISKVANMFGMFDDSGLSTTNYDALLVGWSQLELEIFTPPITLGAAGINYCNGSDARVILTSSPNNWTINDGGLDCATAGVDNENQLAISVYPNPTKDKLCIQGLSTSSKISIYTVFGKLVFSETTSSEVDLKGLQSGVYIIKIMDQQKETTRKFIKN
jgi:surface protein